MKNHYMLTFVSIFILSLGILAMFGLINDDSAEGQAISKEIVKKEVKNEGLVWIEDQISTENYIEEVMEQILADSKSGGLTTETGADVRAGLQLFPFYPTSVIGWPNQGITWMVNYGPDPARYVLSTWKLVAPSTNGPGQIHDDLFYRIIGVEEMLPWPPDVITFIPTEIGTYELIQTVKSDDDPVPENDVKVLELPVVGLRKLDVRILNSQNGYSDRYFLFAELQGYYYSYFYQIYYNQIIEVPDLPMLTYTVADVTEYPVIRFVVDYINVRVEENAKFISESYIEMIEYDEMIAHAIYANEFSGTYENNYFDFEVNTEEIPMPEVEDIRLYSCVDWNFREVKCNTNWNEVENTDVYFNDNSAKLFVSGLVAGNVEAFAVGESV